MLERVHAPNPALREDPERPPCAVAAAEGRDGLLVIARCDSDRQCLEILRQRSQQAELGVAAGPVKIAAGETIATAMAWLSLPSQEAPVLCIGFSNGGVSFFTGSGEVSLSFVLAQAKPVVRVRLSTSSERGSGPTEGQCCRLLLLQEGSILTLLAADRVQAAIEAAQSQVESPSHDGIQHTTYVLRGREATCDSCFLDHSSWLEDVFAVGTCPALVALGTQPFLSLHRLDVDTSARSLLGAAASALGSYARAWVLGSKQTAEPKATTVPLSAGLIPYPRDVQLKGGTTVDSVIAAKFIDPMRVGDTMHAAPSCAGTATLAATCDAFGRVALLCLETLRVLHLWKGYRDAQVAWLCFTFGSGSEASLEVTPDGRERTLKLIIYAPRRGLLELWDLGDASGPRREDAAAVGMDGHLLDCHGRVYLLSKTGQVDQVHWRRHQPASACPTPGPVAELSEDPGALSEPGSDAFGSPAGAGSKAVSQEDVSEALRHGFKEEEADEAEEEEEDVSEALRHGFKEEETDEAEEEEEEISGAPQHGSKEEEVDEAEEEEEKVQEAAEEAKEEVVQVDSSGS